MRLITFVFLLVTTVSFVGAQTSATDEKVLQDLWSDFEAAFNRNDAKAIAGFYTPDGDRISSTGKYSKGRESIEAEYQVIFDRRKADPTIRPFHAEIEIRFLRPDVALLDGTWKGKRDGKDVRGTFTLTATKENGKWYIAAGRDRGVLPPENESSENKQN